MNQRGAPIVTWVAISLLALLTTSCSKDHAIPEGEDPRITELRGLVTSDFEREVLADGKITDQEYETSHQLFKTCMEDRGYSVEFRNDGGYSIAAPGPETTTEEHDADYADCEPGTMRVVAPLYEWITYNPGNIDLGEAIVDCLKRYDLVPESYTKDDLAAPADLGQTDAERKAVDGCSADPLNYVATELDRATSAPAESDDS